MTSTQTGLVVGGGIAGMISAIALKKAGFEPVIFEARETAADGVGAFLTLAVNGLDALGALGLDATGWGGFPTPRMVLRLGTGRELARIDRGMARADGTTTITIRRADLYEHLRDAASARGIPTFYGKRLEGTRRSPSGGVVARFDDGTEVGGDFVVGADGVHSRVRKLIDPDAPSPRFVGLLNVGGYTRNVTVPGEAGTMQLVFGKRCFFGYVPHPDGEVWWFANPGRKKEPSREELRAIPKERWREDLVEAFAADRSPAAELVRASDEIMTGWATYDMPRVPTWYANRMIVIGDAAHAASPSSGQGASMAIEDGVMLAKCLRDAPSVEAAFAGFEELRRERVEWIVERGRKNGDGKTPGPLGRVVRDLALRMIFSRRDPEADDLAKVFDYRVTWDEREVALCWA